MKVALQGTMHFEMLHDRKMQKALWNGHSRIGTRGADNAVEETRRSSYCNKL